MIIVLMMIERFASVRLIKLLSTEPWCSYYSVKLLCSAAGKLVGAPVRSQTIMSIKEVKAVIISYKVKKSV